jgi:hypothetical protein
VAVCGRSNVHSERWYQHAVFPSPGGRGIVPIAARSREIAWQSGISIPRPQAAPRNYPEADLDIQIMLSALKWGDKGDQTTLKCCLRWLLLRHSATEWAGSQPHDFVQSRTFPFPAAMAFVSCDIVLVRVRVCSIALMCYVAFEMVLCLHGSVSVSMPEAYWRSVMRSGTRTPIRVNTNRLKINTTHKHNTNTLHKRFRSPEQQLCKNYF